MKDLEKRIEAIEDEIKKNDTLKGVGLPGDDEAYQRYIAAGGIYPFIILDK